MVLIVALLIAGSALVGCGGASDGGGASTPMPDEEAPHAGEQLLSERCQRCHGLDRIERATFDREGWERVVDRMVAKGARLTPEERAALIEYLAGR